jgi:hypothetical protein
MATSSNCETGHMVCIRSIGRAVPGAALAVARGCTGAGNDLLRAIYRAPVLIGENLDKPRAEELAGVLVAMGFEADAVPRSEAAKIEPGPLVDVALACLDPLKLDDVARELAQFCGTSDQIALQQIVTAPGIVLGGVSMATVTALSKRLEGLGADLMVSDPQEACYTLFAGRIPVTLLDRLVRKLTVRGIDCTAISRSAEAVTLQDLPYDVAQEIWQSFGRSGVMRIVNQNFLRFSVHCNGLLEPQAVKPVSFALEARFGIPPEIVPHLLQESDVILAENLPLQTALDHINALADLGLKVEAQLEGFAPVQLEIARARDPAAMMLLLGAFGIASPDAVPALPYLSPPMALPLARHLRAKLEVGAGADACLTEVAA